ncbi:uncharacterized protein LOC133907057 [Phragmites australis]|uniref:uncharacterized protein LOC133907057 n=1 Tax=Phragmites australis TaxID=29695 RepID=UPI002D776882|nr:uncharacterized protein LOC133907057 [Phragmites australis]
MTEHGGTVDPSPDSRSNRMESKIAAPPIDGGSKFILDSGSTVHATGDASMLKETRTPRCGDAASITRRDGKEMRVVAVGSVSTPEFAVPDVHHVPELGPGVTLVSVSQLALYGFAAMFYAAGCLVVDRTGAVVGEGRMQGGEEEEGLYRLAFLRIPSSSPMDPPDPCPERSLPPAASTASCVLLNQRVPPPEPAPPTNACS